MTTKKKTLILVVFILITHLAGVIGSLFTAPSINNWYVFLEKPSFSPPNWLFAPAWLTLYTLMGIAAFLVWAVYNQATEEGAKKRRKNTLWLYGIHLIFNALWSVIFFGLQNPAWAFFEIVILWILTLLVLLKFYKVKKAAGMLLLPYLLWVSFAATLNFFIWQWNI